MPSETWARMGGGGNFGSSHSSGGYSGGHSSGGSGDGLILYLLIRLCLEHPLIGIPMLLIGGYISLVGTQRGANSYKSHVITTGNAKYDVAMNRNEKNKLIQRDNNFDEIQFLERAKQTFLALQNSWNNQNMSPVRSMLSDAIYDRLNLNLELNKANGYINKITDIDIKDAHVVSYKCDEFFDVIIVAISASAADYYIKEGSDKKYSLSTDIFKEYWSFLRKPGTKTLQQGGAIEGFCPNCGSPLKLSDKIECMSCQALITSGEYDWVLSEITQAKAFQHRNPDLIAGASQLKQQDKALNIQYLEDRASIMFWRYHSARYFCNAKYLSKMANNKFLNIHKNEFQLNQKGMRTFAQDLAVGSVEIIRFDNKADMNRCHIIVTWSGCWQESKPGPGDVPSFLNSRIYKHKLIMCRHKDAISNPKHALSANCCIGCGAPETVDSSNCCSYCGIALNDGLKNWVLDSIEPYKYEDYHDAISEAKAKLPDVIEAPLYNIPIEEVIAAMILVMDSDGKRDIKERETLLKMANKLNVSQKLFNSIENHVKNNPDFKLDLKNHKETHEVLRQLIRLALADGNVCAAERKAIKNLLSDDNITDSDINMMINTERKYLYKQAKAKLKKIS